MEDLSSVTHLGQLKKVDKQFENNKAEEPNLATNLEKAKSKEKSLKQRIRKLTKHNKSLESKMMANKGPKKDLRAEVIKVEAKTSLEQAKAIQALQQEVEKMKRERNPEKEQQQVLEKDPGEDHMSRREPEEEERPKETQAAVGGMESLKNNMHCKFGTDCYNMRRTGDCKFLHTQHHSQRGFKSKKPCRDGNYCKRLSCNFSHIKCGSPKEMETHMRVYSPRQLVRKGEETMKLENTQR